MPRGLWIAAMPASVRLLPLALGLGVVLFLSLVWLTQAWGSGDAVVYLAAGERLNAGHDLYSLVPGDRPVRMHPPYWTVPLLSPPLIGVIWQPLATLPAGVGVTVWAWGATASAMASLLLLVRSRPVLTGVVLVACATPFAVLAWSGNVDAFRLPATMAVWWLATRGRPGTAGLIVGVMTAIKLTPAILIVWLLLLGSRRGVVAALLTTLVATGLAVVVAGADDHLRYLEVIRETMDSGTAEISLAGVARTFGLVPELARWIPNLIVMAALAAMLALRHRPGPSFVVAIIAQVFGAPAAGMHTYGLLLAALAPAAWPVDRPPIRSDLATAVRR